MNLESTVAKVILFEELGSVIQHQPGNWTVRHAIGFEDRFILELNHRYYYTVVEVRPSQVPLPRMFYYEWTPPITIEQLDHLL